MPFCVALESIGMGRVHSNRAEQDGMDGAYNRRYYDEELLVPPVYIRGTAPKSPGRRASLGKERRGEIE